MHVFRTVAGNAPSTREDFLLHWDVVAFDALQRGVCAAQFEVRLLMVEVPVPPAARVMAGFAIDSQSSQMHVVFFVARPAVGACVLECVGGVAFLARNQDVQAGQRKTRLPMIEPGVAP